MKIIAFLAAIVAAASASSFAVAVEVEPREIAAGSEKALRKAREDESKALENLAKAEADATAARVQMAEGERVAAEAITVIDAQRSAYNSFAVSVGAAATASAAALEASTLKGIAKLWEDAEERQKKGAKLVRDGQKDLAKAEERRVKSEARLSEARLDLANLGAAGGASGSYDAPEPQILRAPETVETSTPEILLTQEAPVAATPAIPAATAASPAPSGGPKILTGGATTPVKANDPSGEDGN